MTNTTRSINLLLMGAAIRLGAARGRCRSPGGDVPRRRSGATRPLAGDKEGRFYMDAVDVSKGKLLDRLTDVTKPCCVELIPGSKDGPVRVLVSNIGDGTLQLVEVSQEGRLKTLGKTQVGEAPKRLAFLP